MVLKKIFDKKVAVGPKPGLKPEQWPVEVENGAGELVKVGKSDKVEDSSESYRIRKDGDVYKAFIGDKVIAVATTEGACKKRADKYVQSHSSSKVSDSQGYGTVDVDGEDWQYPLDASIHVDFKLISPDGYEEWCSAVEEAHPDANIRGQIQSQRKYGNNIGDAVDYTKKWRQSIGRMKRSIYWMKQKPSHYPDVDKQIAAMEKEIKRLEGKLAEKAKAAKESKVSDSEDNYADAGFRKYLEKHVSPEAIEPLLKTGKYDGEVMFTDEDTDETIPIEVHYNLKKFWNDYQKWKKRWDEYEAEMDNFYKERDSRAAERERRDRISELSRQLQRLYRDMENDPEVLDEQGNGGEATDRYGVKMSEIEEEIERLSKESKTR